MTTIWINNTWEKKIRDMLIEKHELDMDTLTQIGKVKLQRLVVKHLTGQSLPDDYICKGGTFFMNGTNYIKKEFGPLQVNSDGYSYN